MGHVCMFVVLGLRTGFAAAHGGGWLGTARQGKISGGRLGSGLSLTVTVPSTVSW